MPQIAQHQYHPPHSPDRPQQRDRPRRRPRARRRRLCDQAVQPARVACPHQGHIAPSRRTGDGAEARQRHLSVRWLDARYQPPLAGLAPRCAHRPDHRRVRSSRCFCRTSPACPQPRPASRSCPRPRQSGFRPQHRRPGQPPAAQDRKRPECPGSHQDGEEWRLFLHSDCGAGRDRRVAMRLPFWSRLRLAPRIAILIVATTIAIEAYDRFLQHLLPPPGYLIMDQTWLGEAADEARRIAEATPAQHRLSALASSGLTKYLNFEINPESPDYPQGDLSRVAREVKAALVKKSSSPQDVLVMTEDFEEHA